MRQLWGAIIVALLLISLYPNSVRSEYLKSDINYAPNAIVIVISNDYYSINPTVTNGIVVTGIANIDQLNQKYGVSHMWQLFPKAIENGVPEMEGYYSLTFDGATDLESTLADFDALSEIELVEAVAIHKLNFYPNDPNRTFQWGLGKINAYNAWNITQGDASVSLGIADSGVDWDHPDLNNDIWTNSAEMGGTPGYDDDGNGYVDDFRGWDWVTGVNGAAGEDDQTPDNNPMDFAGHGTHVGGIAAAETHNSIGVSGLGFDCLIMALRIGWQDIDGWSYVRMDFAASAFYYAANKGVKAINCSWGSSNSSGISSAANYAMNNGVVIVSSAGNSNNSSASYLCSRSDVISVAATNSADQKASFSNYGSWVDVSAPGVNIYATYYNNTYAYLDGTSMSSPFVTGLVGLLCAANPSLTRLQVRTAIVNNTDNIDAQNPGYNGLLGTGRIDTYESILSVTATVDPPVLFSPSGGEYIVGNTPTFVWSESDGASNYQIQVDDLSDFTSPIINVSSVTDTVYVSPYGFSAGVDNIWYWRVRASNGGTWSDYTSSETFHVDPDPPPVTTLLTPENNVWAAETMPLFTWLPVTDNGTGLDKYFIQIDNDANFIPPYLYDDSTGFTFYEISSNLFSNVRYYWRVNARDFAGNYSEYALGNFGVDLTPPAAPVNYEITPDGWSDSPDFTLTWDNPPDSSGISKAFFKIGSAPESNYDTTGHFDASPANFHAGLGGTYPIFLWLIDNAGNTIYVTNRSDTAYFDNSSPSGCVASSADTSGNESFTVNWSAGVDDASGLSGLYDVRYKDGSGGSWTDWQIDFAGLSDTFSGVQGHEYFFEARTSDIAGNYEDFTGLAETSTVVDTNYSGPEYLPGDANNSGAVNGLDVIYLVNYLKGIGPVPDPLLGGDANGSCSVNGLDVIYLVQYFKGGADPFAGNCG